MCFCWHLWCNYIVYKDAARWIEEAEAWLEKRFALELPELTHWELMQQGIE